MSGTRTLNGDDDDDDTESFEFEKTLLHVWELKCAALFYKLLLFNTLLHGWLDIAQLSIILSTDFDFCLMD